MKNKIIKIVLIVTLLAAFIFSGCTASCSRAMKSCNSDLNGGLDRIVNVYSYDGELIATYEGLIDIDNNTNGSVMFDLNGRRYVYYNAIVEVIEKE